MVQIDKTRSASNARLRHSWQLGLCALFLAAPAYSQSLGEIARHERERKQDHQSYPTHVYDNDDLERPQILLPEDQERAHASKEKTAPASDETHVEAAGSARKSDMNAPAPSDVAPRSRTFHTHLQEPKSLPGLPQPVSGAPSLGYTALPRSPGSPAVQPGAPVEDVGKAIPRREIAGSEKPSGRRVRVQPGDSLWKLAYRYLGQGKNWQALVECNPLLTDPQRLKVGMWVRLPDETLGVSPPEIVRIKPGDSLWKLTQSHLGNGRAWSCVAQANPQLHSAHLIHPGQILKIPESCAETSSLVRFSEVPPESLPRSNAQSLREAR